MRLIGTDQYEGYLLTDLQKHLGEEKFALFLWWFRGQTGVLHNGQRLVYKHDYQRWRKGLEPND